MRRDSLRIDMVLPPQVPQTLIDKAEHARHGKTAGFRPHDGPFNARLPTAFGNGFRQEHNRPNDFVIMLNVVDKVEFVLRKVLRSRHAMPPPRGFHRPTPACAHMGPAMPPPECWSVYGAPPTLPGEDGGRTDRENAGVETIIYYNNCA